MEPFGFHGSPWHAVYEQDGLRYAATLRWLIAATSLDEADRHQALFAARYFAHEGDVAAFVGDQDRAEFARDRLDLFLGSVEPWYVRG